MADSITTPQTQEQQPATPAKVDIDYEKIASLVQGKQTVTEDTVLKSYFKEQGLSPDEMKQAISAFKDQKASQQPDVEGMQKELTQAQQRALTAEINQQATVEALGLGVDIKTVPYVLKIADLSDAVSKDGAIDAEKIKTALSQVLEDVPALKPDKVTAKGFKPIGAGGTPTPDADNNELARIFGNK